MYQPDTGRVTFFKSEKMKLFCANFLNNGRDMTSNSQLHSDKDGLGIKRTKQIKNKRLVEKRRNQILDAALKLFLKKGIRESSIRDICEESKVNRASIYDYVKNKDEIVDLIMHELHVPDRKTFETLEKIESADLDPLREFLKSFFQSVWERKSDSVLLIYRETHKLKKKTKEKVLKEEAALVDEIEEAIKKHGRLAKDDFRIPIIANMIAFYAAFMPLRDWNMKKYDQDVVNETVVDVIMNFIKPTKN